MMNRCVAISAFIFIIHVTVAAPPIFFDLFLDEMTEINIRMGDAIQRAREKAKAMKSVEWENAVDQVIQDIYQQIESAFDNDDGQMNVFDERGIDPKGQYSFDQEKYQHQNSSDNEYEGDVAKQWNDWTDPAWDRAVLNENGGQIENVQQDIEEEPNSTSTYEDQNVDGNENAMDWLNQENQNKFDYQQVDNASENAEGGRESGREGGNAMDYNEVDAYYKQESHGGKHFEGHEIEEGSKGWFGQAVDSYLGIFD